MSFARRNIAQSDIHVDINTTSEAVLPLPCLVHSTAKAVMPADVNKALPPIKVENQLSGEEMHQLHELWNVAGLSARAHRRRHRGQPLTPGWIPARISIPNVENVPPPLLSADPPPTTPTTVKRRWGFRSASTQGEDRNLLNTPETLRSVMALDRLKTRLRYARSAPNLVDQSKSVGHTNRQVTPKKTAETSVPRTPNSDLATPETVLQSDHMDANAIYFTIDLDWRSSRGSMEFQFITPVPSSPTSLGMPDSPLLHRHHSLDQLSFAAAQRATRGFAAVTRPEECPSNAILGQIDEMVEVEP